MRNELQNVLRCPIDRSPLTVASEALLGELNSAIRERRLYNLGGQRLDRAIEGGLVRSAGDLIYPIIDGIPLLIKDEAISLASMRKSKSGN